MKLPDWEMRLLTELLVESDSGPLPGSREAQLRGILARHNPPTAAFPLPDLLRAAHALLGAEAMYRTLVGEPSPNVA